MWPKYATVADLTRAYWPVMACALVVSAVATPLCRRLALRFNVVDRPDDWLKPHHEPIPYLGGVAIFLGWAAGILVAMALFGPHDPQAHPTGRPTYYPLRLTGVLLGGFGVTALGLFDDLRLASPRFKLIGGTLIAVALMLFGVGRHVFTNLLQSVGVHSLDLPTWWTIAYSAPVTILIVLGAINATNLIDGMDGLCSGVLAIIAAGFLVLAAHMHVYGDWLPLDTHRVVESLAIMGAALGFLPYNRNPAKIFMGDAGSMLLGLYAAVMLISFTSSHGLRWILGSMMVFGLPIADMVLTLVRRWRHQKPLMMGDRSHFYDQLLDRGWPLRRVVRTSYALAVAFALLGCSAILIRIRYLIPIYALFVLGLVVIVVRMGMVRVDHPRGNPDKV